MATAKKVKGSKKVDKIIEKVVKKDGEAIHSNNNVGMSPNEIVKSLEGNEIRCIEALSSLRVKRNFIIKIQKDILEKIKISEFPKEEIVNFIEKRFYKIYYAKIKALTFINILFINGKTLKNSLDECNEKIEALKNIDIKNRSEEDSKTYFESITRKYITLALMSYNEKTNRDIKSAIVRFIEVHSNIAFTLSNVFEDVRVKNSGLEGIKFHLDRILTLIGNDFTSNIERLNVIRINTGREKVNRGEF